MSCAYLAGSIPFGLLIGFSRGVDIRHHGSCNIGATNCGRVLGRKWGLMCFVLDVIKGAAPVLAAGWWFKLLTAESLSGAQAWWWTGIAVAAVLGHVFPVWLKFKGGKGVATGFGAVTAIWPYMTLPGVGVLLTWILFTGTFRYVGLSSVIAALLLPVYLLVGAVIAGWQPATVGPFVTIATVMALLILVRHRGNLYRIWMGTEARVGR